MNILRYGRLWMALLYLASFAPFASSCNDDDALGEEPYIYFGEEFTDIISYNQVGGTKTIEMYTNMGPWIIEPEFVEDWEWLDIWPREGNRSGRFTVTVLENDDAYSRFSNVNVVVDRRVVKSFTIRQIGSEPTLELDLGSNTLTSPSAGNTLKVDLITNIGWKATAMGDAANWISFGEKDDFSQEITVAPNTGSESRTAEIEFRAIGNTNDHIYATLYIKQFDSSQDPYNGTEVKVAQLLDMLGNDGGTIDQNLWVDVHVTSDRSKLNLPSNLMFVQDDSGRGLCLEFASPRENIYNLNDNIRIHMLETQFLRDSDNGSLKMVNLGSSQIFEHRTSSGGIEPVKVSDLSELGNLENTLVTLEDVEIAIPMGTYVNIDETSFSNATALAYPTNYPNTAPHNDTVWEHGILLRDREGNTVKMMSRNTFLDRYSRLMPEGTGDITGIVTHRFKNNKWESLLRIRSNEDNRIGDNTSSRHHRTLVQFGPFIGRWDAAGMYSTVGNAQMKTTMYERVVGEGSGSSLEWAYSYARRNPATITVNPDGTQTATPPLSSSASQNPTERMYTTLQAQTWWNGTGSTLNREGIEDQLGEAWLFTVNDLNATGDISMVFSMAGTGTAPGYYRIEWCEEENARWDQWHKIEEKFNFALWNCSYQCQHYILELPDELKTLGKFTIRFRVVENERGNLNGYGIEPAGSVRFGHWSIVEKK